MNHKFYKLYILIILIIIAGCTKINLSFIKSINIFNNDIFKNKKQAYLFYYKDYYSVFIEKVRIHELIKNKLNRLFYKVNEIKIKSFITIPSEINKIKTQNINGIIFLDSYQFPLIFKTSILENKNIKLVTYDIPINEINIDSKIPIFNIIVDDRVIKDRILGACFRFSKKKDLSDCGILINNDYSICSKFVESIKNKKVNIDILELTSNDKRDPNKILAWLSQKERKVVVLFGYELNRIFLDIKKDQFNNLVFVEAMTKYSESTEISAYLIDIIWDKVVEAAVNGGQFNKFINLKNDSDKSIFICPVKFSNIVSFKKNNIIKKDDSVIIKDEDEDEDDDNEDVKAVDNEENDNNNESNDGED